MIARSKRLLCLLLPLSLPAQTVPVAEPDAVGTVVVQIRIVQGDGAVHVAGSRASKGLIVEVTNEVGRPVEGVAVSFRLPETGPSGLFANGLKSEIAITGPDGRAGVYGMRWNQTPGRFEIRVTAAKGRARAGMLVAQYIAEAQDSRKTEAVVLPPYKPRRRWLPVTVLVAGVAAGTVGAGLAFGRKPPSATPSASQASLSVGSPTITIGGPP